MKKGVLRNFTKFTKKHLRQSLFFNKVAGKRDSGTELLVASQEPSGTSTLFYPLHQCRYDNDANSKRIKTLEIVSLNQTDPSKIKHPRKCDTKTLTPKSRQAKTHCQKLFFKQFLTIPPEF